MVTDPLYQMSRNFWYTGSNCRNYCKDNLNEVIARFGSPLSLHSDKGSNYEIKIFTELCYLLEVKKTRTITRNTKCNGQTERFNRTLIRMIRSYLSTEQSNWALNLGCLAAAYRATPNESTKLSPNLLMLGKEVRLPSEIAFGSATCKNQDVTTYGQYVEILKKKMQKAHEICRENLMKNAKRQKESYDTSKAFNKYEKGDIAWLLQLNKKEGVCPKLQKPYIGPFLITEKLNNQNYKLLLSKSGKVIIVHHDKLKPYTGDTPSKWIGDIKD